MDTFKAMDWNVGGQDVDEALAYVAAQLAKGVTLFCFQETRAKFIAGLTKLGLHTVSVGWATVAWLPGPWVTITTGGGPLTPQSWTSGDGRRVLKADMAMAILCDLKGRSLTLASGKLPPNIQDGAGRRVGLAIDALEGQDDWAEDSQTTAWLSGMDINYDIDTGNRVPALDRAARQSPNLRLIKSGEPTIGDREIDVFFILRLKNGGRLKPVGKPEVGGRVGGGKHRYHVREFAWVA